MKTIAALAVLSVASPASSARPRLLLLGDSHSAQAFGRALDASLRAGYPGYDVETHGYCAAQPAWFLPAAKLKPQLRQYSGMSTTCGFYDSVPGRPPEEGTKRPAPIIDDLGRAPPGSVAVIELGTNLSTWDGGKLGYWGMDLVGRLAEEARALGWRCVWVGPPQALDARWKDLPGSSRQSSVLAAAVRKAARGCDFVDSIALTRGLPDGLRPDGLHFKPEAARAWAAGVYKKIESLVPQK